MKKLFWLLGVAACVVVLMCCTTACESAKAGQDGGTTNFPMYGDTTQQQPQQQPQQTVAKGVVFYGPVSWNNEAEWSNLPITREQVKELAKNTPSSKKLAYAQENAYVTRIQAALEIRGIQSAASSTQYVVWYTYTTDNSNEATGLILIQAPSGNTNEVRNKIRDLASKLNEQRCCKKPGCDPVLFGGCIVETQCNSKANDPCKANANGNCGPCQQQGTVIQEGGDSSMSANQPNASRAVPQRRRR